MDSARLQRMSELFDSARLMPAAEREAFLREACKDDADMLAQVRSLLEHHDRPGQSLDQPLMQKSLDVAKVIAEASSRSQSLPERIGHYRIIRKIGEGGMGTVFEAQQENPRRTVALKVIHAGVASANMLRRLELEAHILGLLQHPGIAQIFEAGTFDLALPGAAFRSPQPFLAMELVEGVSVTEFAAQRNLGTRERLALVASIADAVQHAHQKGVIHRDLKPGNILVDASGQPKILDFGVARVTDSDVRMTTLHTNVGQLIGTLPYMSPEQASGDADSLDTRSDVYALGVLAYELLAKRLPYDLTRRVVQDAVRVIRDEEPTRLSMISRTFRGDIETIIGKALEKDRTRRYQAASDLAEDIRRHLRDEAVIARPPSRLYQFQKFAKRNKALVTGAAAVLLVLLAGVIGTSLALVRAIDAEYVAVERLAQIEKEKSRAVAAEGVALERLGLIEKEKARVEAEKAKVDAVSRFQQEMLESVDPRVAMSNRDITMREVLDGAAKKIEEGSLKDQPDIEGAVRYILGATYFSLGAYSEAAKHLERSVELRRQSLGPEHLELAESMAMLGETYREIGDVDRAEPLTRDALAMRKKLCNGDSEDVADSINNMALIEKARGDIDACIALNREALAMRRRVLGDDNPDLMQSLNNLAMALMARRGDPQEIDALFQEGVDLGRKTYHGDHLHTANLLQNQAQLREATGDVSGALEAMREALRMRQSVLGDEHSLVAESMNNLGAMLKRKGDYAEAEPLYRRSLEIRIKVWGEDDYRVSESLNNLAILMQSMGRTAEGEPMMRRALEIRRSLADGGDDAMLALYMSNCANMLSVLNRTEEAEAMCRESIAMRERLGDSTSVTYGQSLLTLASIMRDRSAANLLEIESLQRRSLALFQAMNPPPPQQVSYALNNLGPTLREEGQIDESEAVLRESLELRRKVHGSDSPITAATMCNLAATLMEKKQWEEASALLEESLAVRRAKLPAGHLETTVSLTLLGSLRVKQDRPAEGEPLLREALEIRVKNLPAGHLRIADCQALLGSCLVKQGKFDEAEPLLLESCQSMLGNPAVTDGRRKQALDALIDMYEASGRSDQASSWRAKQKPSDAAPPTTQP